MLGDPSPHPGAKTVLIVEDNELNLKLLHDRLEYQGYTVFTTRLGEPALELARQHRPDLILIDVQLPDISGMEAARRLKDDEQTRTNRGQDIIAIDPEQPRGTCAKTEIPGNLSGEASMTTTTHRAPISGMRRARAAPGLKRFRPARRFQLR